MTNVSHDGTLREPDLASAAMRRIGRIAGVVSLAALVFVSLYFFVLYIASE